MSKRSVLLILFAPFLLNLAASFAMYSLVPREMWVTDYQEAVKTLYSYIWSYQSAFMILVQVSFGLALLGRVELSYDLRRSDAPLIVALVLLSEALFFVEYPLLPVNGTRWFSDVMRRIPVWAKYMNALLAPFTAGVFEEVIWRGFGIENLRKFMSDSRAVAVQAIAFALWHVSPLHIPFVFVIGLAYGLAYLRRGSLGPLIVAHVVTDLAGFSYFLLS